jgi:hypothetical protein
MSEIKNIIVAAVSPILFAIYASRDHICLLGRIMLTFDKTPTSPLVTHLIHALLHQPRLEVTFLTRETSISLRNIHSHTKHDHDEHNHGITHIKTSFSEAEMKSALDGKDALICCLTGSDLHLSGPLIDAASLAGVKLIIASEYGFDTSNLKIRSLLPPYQTRFEIQEKLRKSGMIWRAIYSGIILEDAMRTDGVLGIDVMWASAVIFPGNDDSKVPISTLEDIAKSILEALSVTEKSEGIYTSSFKATINEIVEVVEKELDRTVDRYEGNLEGANKEASERMKLGYFDGGVALMGRVAAWDPEINSWAAWKDAEETKQGNWQEEVRRTVRMIRGGDIGGDGCGC